MPVYKSKYVFILLSGFIFNLSSCKKNDYSAGASTDITVILKEDLPSTCAEMFLTSKHDNLGRPYLYIAAKDGGLKNIQHHHNTIVDKNHCHFKFRFITCDESEPAGELPVPGIG